MADIVYIGNYRHPFCTEVHLARELEGLGHIVARLQEPPGGSGPEFVAEIERYVDDATDLVLFTRTWGLDASATQLWRRLEQRGITTASYHLDLYRTLARGSEERLQADPFWSTGHVFTPDGDPASEEWFEDHGIIHHYSPPAVVSDECKPGVANTLYRGVNVGFVGSYGYHDEWTWRPRLIDWLGGEYGKAFRRFGGDVAGGPWRGTKLNDLYASVPVFVGDSLCPMCPHCLGAPTGCGACGGTGSHRNYWSDRYYETIGRGGFLIAPRVPGIESHLTDGAHCWFYDWVPGRPRSGDLDQIRDLVQWSLANPDQRRSMAAEGQQHVAANHTYRHRLARAMSTMGFE